MEKEKSILHEEMLESFTHVGEMADLVIDDRRDRGGISNGGAQQGGTCWVQYLGTWDS